VLINNAGIRLKNLPIEDIPLDEWRLYFEVNFLGAVELTRRAIPLLRKRGRGVICNINSSSITAPMPFLAPYRATKGALAAFSETLRSELAA
jgi:NAD(P)-dependent dehydrogenase (short-subunit alcohol dehydrogenase family)